MVVGIQPSIADAGSELAFRFTGSGCGVRRFVLPLLLVAACGFPRPRDVGDDAPGDSGMPIDPAATIHVSPSGDDANDGHARPVKTLKHGIGLAAADSKITHIILASGMYSTATGETFPYTVPTEVTILGPAGGGATLTGMAGGPGITVNHGALRDIDLQDFATAVTVTGEASLKNIRVLTSGIAVQAETPARLSIDNLTISGAPGACSTGIILNGAAQLTVVMLQTRNLGVTLDARDDSIVDITKATITGDPSCTNNQLMSIVSTASFRLSDSLLDGGSSGIGILGKSQTFNAQIDNTILRNMKNGGIGGNMTSAGATFKMMGGEISDSGQAASLIRGVWTFVDVGIRRNKGLAIYLQEGRIVMRGCSITNNGSGVDVFDNATGDLGTAADPGNNTFQGNTDVGLSIDGNFGGAQVDAVGNTWNPLKQGANENGNYPTTDIVVGPVPFIAANNFDIASGWSLSR